VVHLDGVSLRYRLAKQRIPSLKEYAISWMKGALAYEELWALQDVSLELARGDSLGIVGRNGAGKSSLLKVVSGVLTPTKGRSRVEGVVAPILELGTGFDGELTGLENIYLNALLLGRQRREIYERLDAIVEFSGLREFIRSPLRNYSSGMLARLGFSIATAWQPDVLILDEVLAVGDARFVLRCEKRLEELHRTGTTLLLVSHNVQAVRKTCRLALWLDRGRVQAAGPVEEVVDRYVAFSAGG
jgi:ABC-type polysaccharide/polyol phosphate transport system ATPase subunit